MFLSQNQEPVKRSAEAAFRTEGTLSPGSISGFAQSGMAGCAPNASERDLPTISTEVDALLKCLHLIQENLGLICGKLFGPSPECNEQKCPAPDSLQSRIISASILASHIANDIQGIRNRI